MALKSATGKLYLLFSACLPNNEEVKKRLLLEQITESKEYRELEAYNPMNNAFNELYSKDKLSGFSVNELSEIKKAIPKIIPVTTKLINSIKYGDAWKLSAKDLPNFYSPKSLDNLSAKLSAVDGAENITNITDNNFMAIFSDKTVTSLEPINSVLTVSDLKNMKKAIKTKLSNKSYCINTAEIANIKDQFDEAIGELNKFESSIKYQKYRLINRKIAVTAVILLIMVGMATLDLMHGLSLGFFEIIAIISTVIYWIKG